MPRLESGHVLQIVEQKFDYRSVVSNLDEKFTNISLTSC